MRRLWDRLVPLPAPRLALTAGLAILLLGGAALADVLILTDGTRLEGTIKRSGENYTVTREDGTVTTIRADRVASVELRGGSATQSALDTRLSSLRRSVANLDDLDVIIAKYQDFVDRNAGTPVGEEAAQELEQWRDYQARGLVKYGGEWLTPAQRDLKQRDAFLEASDARMKIKAGELEEAERILARMLRDDPRNMSAHYLAGVIELKRGEIAKARDHLEKVRSQEPRHPPTLVNLAAVNIELGNHARALTFLTDAMNAAPGNREILDNVAEAMELLPEKVAEGRPADEARQMFLSQDAALRQRMAERGLYRWGGTWVDREELDQLQALEKEIKQRVADLAAQHDQLTTEIAGLERRHETNKRVMDRMVANSFFRDEEGRIIRIPLPPEYYQIAQEQDGLLAQRDALIRQRTGLEQAAANEQARYPTAPFKGRLEPIGEDGVPVPGAPAGAGPSDEDAATRPADDPGENE